MKYPENAPPPVVDTSGASLETGLSIATLEKLRVYGGGPAYMKLGKAVRYRVSDLEDWMNARRVRSTSEVSKVA